MSDRSINITTVSKSISGRVTLPDGMLLVMKMTELYRSTLNPENLYIIIIMKLCFFLHSHKLDFEPRFTRKNMFMRLYIKVYTVSQKLQQHYIRLGAYYTSQKLFKMGILPDLHHSKCCRDHGDFIHLLWCCPKLYLYWSGVLQTLNMVFQVTVPSDPKHCIFGILDVLQLKKYHREAIAGDLF